MKAIIVQNKNKDEEISDIIRLENIEKIELFDNDGNQMAIYFNPSKQVGII